MKIILFIMLFNVIHLLANSSKTEISSYYESYNFTDSTIKEKGYALGFIGSHKSENSFYKLGYEYEYTQSTPAFHAKNGDFKIHKLYSKYAYSASPKWKINLNYINVLDDNIAPTSNGSIYGLRVTYSFIKPLSLNITQFLSDYEEFDVYQSDIKIVYKMKFDTLKIKLQSITKYMNLKDYQSNGYSKNADSSYLTSGVKVGALYNSYTFGGGAYFGERAFAVMDDGFKLQHHALSFDKTYAFLLAKSFAYLNIKLQYIYLEAKELPSHQNIEVDILRLVGSYKF